MKLSLRQKINIAFVMALIILGLVGFASHRSVTGLVETSQHVGHTHDVVTNLENVLSNIKDAETGQRGYLLTGIESYLEPYRTSTPKIQQSLRSLRSLTADNPSQQHRLDALDPLVASKLAE